MIPDPSKLVKIKYTDDELIFHLDPKIQSDIDNYVNTNLGRSIKKDI